MSYEHFHFSHLMHHHISAKQTHELHQVKLAMPALCRVNDGKKLVQLGEYVEMMPKHSFIVLPHNQAMIIANYAIPEYDADIIFFPDFLIDRFVKYYQPVQQTSQQTLKVSPDNELEYTWQQLLTAIKHKFSDAMIEHMGLALLLSLQQRHCANVLLEQYSNTLTKRCQTILSLDPSTTWTVESMAQRLHMSRATLSRHLAREGVTFKQILDDVRLGKALTLIQTTNMSIGEVVVACGYQCASRFAERFYQRFRITPSALRKAILG